MSLSAERRRQRGDLLRLTAFLTMAALFTAWVAAITSGYQHEDRTSYRAVFTDVSGLAVGDDVRVAGVDVGKVQAIDVGADNRVTVAFDVRSDQRLTTTTRATVQYRNLLGDRIVLLSQEGKPGTALPVGASLPVRNTASALDLDTLLNGFRPLFAGLNPEQVNALSGDLVQVLQGQHTAIANLVQHVSSFTTAIGDREQLIGRVIANLNEVLGTVDRTSGALGELVDQLDALLTGLDRQDTQLLDAADRINGFAGAAAELVGDARGDIRTDLAQLLLTARGINADADTLQKVVRALPQHYRTLHDSASYGNFFNFFLCGTRVQTDAGMGAWTYSDAARCKR